MFRRGSSTGTSTSNCRRVGGLRRGRLGSTCDLRRRRAGQRRVAGRRRSSAGCRSSAARLRREHVSSHVAGQCGSSVFDGLLVDDQLDVLLLRSAPADGQLVVSATIVARSPVALAAMNWPDHVVQVRRDQLAVDRGADGQLVAPAALEQICVARACLIDFVGRIGSATGRRGLVACSCISSLRELGRRSARSGVRAPDRRSTRMTSPLVFDASCAVGDVVPICVTKPGCSAWTSLSSAVGLDDAARRRRCIGKRISADQRRSTAAATASAERGRPAALAVQFRLDRQVLEDLEDRHHQPGDHAADRHQHARASGSGTRPAG